MKNKSIRFLALALTLFGLGMTKSLDVQAQRSGYQQFYDELSPYGMWFHDPQYGYVWSPDVSGDFRPYYTNGYWVMTEYGNTWVSDYPWGWATFHYGRWVYSDFYGWLWIPDNEWGPAWVTWRQGGGYYGWAPMGPGVSINISFGNYRVPYDYWTFIPYRYVHSRSFGRYYSPRRTRTIINNTTIINNVYVDNRSRSRYVTGPRRNEVSARTGRSVSVHRVSERNRAGKPRVSGNAVNMYRPRVSADNARSAAPRNVRKVDLQRDTRGKATQNRRATSPRSRQKANTPVRQHTEQEARTQRSTPESSPNRRVREDRKTPERTQPQRKLSPQERQRQPQRTAPQKRVSPKRDATPNHRVAPQRKARPQREASSQQRRQSPNRSSSRQVESRKSSGGSVQRARSSSVNRSSSSNHRKSVAPARSRVNSQSRSSRNVQRSANTSRSSDRGSRVSSGRRR